PAGRRALPGGRVRPSLRPGTLRAGGAREGPRGAGGLRDRAPGGRGGPGRRRGRRHRHAVGDGRRPRRVVRARRARGRDEGSAGIPRGEPPDGPADGACRRRARRRRVLDGSRARDRRPLAYPPVPVAGGSAPRVLPPWFAPGPPTPRPPRTGRARPGGAGRAARGGGGRRRPGAALERALIPSRKRAVGTAVKGW